MPASNAQPALDLEPTSAAALIVLGRDDAAKAHASYFTADQTLSARAAAAAMGMMVLPIVSDELRALADQLPAGKIFGSGKAFVPFVKGSLYDLLIAHVPLADQVKRPLRLVKAEDAAGEAEGGAAAPDAPITAPNGKAPAMTLPADWSGIVPGSVVLATESREEGWWAAVVTGIDGQAANLKWRDYPTEPAFTRPLTQLALMHPSNKVFA